MNHRLQAMMRRLGVTVLAGSAVTKGLFDRETKAMDLTGKDRAPALAGCPSVLVETATLPAMRVGDPLTVDSRAYEIRDLARESDGALSRLFLKDR